MLKLFATTAAVALLALGAPAMAQTAPTQNDARPGAAAPNQSAPAGGAGTSTRAEATDKKKVNRGDRKFMENAAHGSAKEIALGKIAQQKSQSEDVKKLAETIVKDHEEASQKLMPIAQTLGVDLAEEIAEGQKDDVDDFEKLSGEDFDRKYVAEMVKDHRRDTKEFDEAAQNAKDPQLKAWAGEVAPKLHNHLQMAEAAQKAMQPKTSSTGGADRGTTGSTMPPGAGAPPSGSTSPSR
jgi:putative membrane protein